MERISRFISTISPKLISWRRHFHQFPELGWTEYATTYFIGRQLEELGFTLFIGEEALVSKARMGVPDHETLYKAEKRAQEQGVPDEWLHKMRNGHTGLVAKWDTGKEGKHIALRFDIDALPIFENKQKVSGHFPEEEGFASSVPSVMHACGHDGHAAIGLGVANWIAAFQKELTGSFTLLFQPAEEGSRGAKSMLDRGWLKDVDYFFSGHIGIQPLPLGDVVASTNGFLATSKIDVTFTGKSSHAGVEPQEGKNALLAAAATAIHLHTIPRHRDGVTRINVGTLQAGTGRNVIPDLAELTLETRGETSQLNQYMEDEAIRIIESAAAMYDVEVDIRLVGKGVEVVTKDEGEWKPFLERSTEGSHRVLQIHETMPLRASEDVAYMINDVRARGAKATYFIFGTPLAKGHHHPLFDYDERVLEVALDVYASSILSLTLQ
ncbi:amidohydrolase [Sutcliffiella halmapala]|uniref:amidohydrolase n=1 Tax=Sutcliffiella halmapala TaxID=79882 RepID=UPI0009950616|nr:amidohydrolase [Sutcliffiella halmapala]